MTQKANREVPAVNIGIVAPKPTLYPLPTYMHPLLIDMPPYTVAPVSYDHRISPVRVFIAYTVPFASVDPPNKTPLATLTGPAENALLGLAVDHRTSPLRGSIAAHPPEVVTLLDGFRVKFLPPLLIMLVYTLFLSVAAPHDPPPKIPPGPTSYK